MKFISHEDLFYISDKIWSDGFANRESDAKFSDFFVVNPTYVFDIYV